MVYHQSRIVRRTSSRTAVRERVLGAFSVYAGRRHGSKNLSRYTKGQILYNCVDSGLYRGKGACNCYVQDVL